MSAPTGETVRMFVNGQAMTGGSLHDPLARNGTLIGRVRTAAQYRFWSCRDEFPGLQPVAAGGWAVPGELYAIDYAVLRAELLPREPPELELSVIALEDGQGALAMRYRDGVIAAADELSLTLIPAGLGWLSYLDTLAGARRPAPGL
jgi:gamma-glutamylcyclotransferase (GGCT)/AIG2-like uncharacterized protein YtfP